MNPLNLPEILTVSEFHPLHSSGRVVLIDVREPDETAAGHVAGAVLIPLGQVTARTAEIPREGPVVVMCAAGKRSAMAISRLQAQGYSNLTNLAGGIGAWRQAGLPVAKPEKQAMSLPRQVQITAGLLCAGGVALGFAGFPLGHALAGLVGAGLLFSGLTATCPMGRLLLAAPWNRPKPAGPDTTGCSA